MPTQFLEKTFLIAETFGSSPKFVTELETAGANVLFLPLINYFEKTLSEFDETIARLSGFDWLIFPTPKSVDVFIERLSEKQFDLYELDAIRICTFGETIADRLRFSQIHADVIPRFAETDNILNAISDYLGGENQFENLRFGCFKDEFKELEIVEILRGKQAIVEEIEIYRSEVDAPKNIAKLKALHNGGAIDAAIFPNSESVYDFARIFDDVSPGALNDIKIVAVGELTTQTLIENRIAPHIILSGGNLKNSVENLARYFLN